MSRVKENEEFLEGVGSYIVINDGILDKNLREGAVLSTLLDISKSLAVIADALETANKEKYKAILNNRFGVGQHREDAISRKAVKEMLTEEWTKYMPMELDTNLAFVLEKISELPPLTPKTGKWIEYCYQNFSCSDCDYIVADTDINEYKYCPNCGVRMEVKE